MEEREGHLPGHGPPTRAHPPLPHGRGAQGGETVLADHSLPPHREPTGERPATQHTGNLSRQLACATPQELLSWLMSVY